MCTLFSIVLNKELLTALSQCIMLSTAQLLILTVVFPDVGEADRSTSLKDKRKVITRFHDPGNYHYDLLACLEAVKNLEKITIMFNYQVST